MLHSILLQYDHEMGSHVYNSSLLREFSVKQCDVC